MHRFQRRQSKPRVPKEEPTNKLDRQLTALLLKVRKGAWAGFTNKDVGAVVDAVGWSHKIEKEGAKAVRFVVFFDDGEKLVEEKDPRHRALFAYHLMPALGKRGLKEKVCELLGMKTHEEEAEHRKQFAYGAHVDITNTGTCGCCFALQKRESKNVSGGVGLRDAGTMVRHGYMRPGDGMIFNDCVGIGVLPLEVSVDGPVKMRDGCKRRQLASEAWLASLKAGPESVSITVYKDGRQEQEEVLRSDGRYEKELAKQIEDTEDKVRMWKRRHAAFSNLVNAWVSDELPEVRYPKQQPLKLAKLVFAVGVAG